MVMQAKDPYRNLLIPFVQSKQEQTKGRRCEEKESPRFVQEQFLYKDAIKKKSRYNNNNHNQLQMTKGIEELDGMIILSE